MAERGLNLARAESDVPIYIRKRAMPARHQFIMAAQQFITGAQPFRRIGVTHARPVGPAAAEHEEFR
jgi:hypothetical protein